MSRAYATLFDKNFVYRGLALYESLVRHDAEAILYILCMDSEVYALLESMVLEQTCLIKLEEFEDEELKKVKQDRTIAEYCWTASSCLMWYVLETHPELAQVVYLDSDLYFFSSPKPIFEEMGEDSILIMKHDYVPKFQYLERLSGIYNVAMVVINNDERGRLCLSWWRERCLEWCYSRYEDGKFGDQKYLDDWPSRFEGVHVLKHNGGDVAPWNIANYGMSKKDNRIYVDNDPLIFYHFHSLKMYNRDSFKLFHRSYNITEDVNQWIYAPYIATLQSLMNTVKATNTQYTYGFNTKPTMQEELREHAKSVYWGVKRIFIKNAV